MTNERILETDVLIIGGSGAGCSAAIAAKRSGARVLMLCKGTVGHSGNSQMAGAGIGIDGESGKNCFGYEAADETLTKDVLFEDIIQQSFYLSDQNLAKQFVEESPQIVHEMVEWGKSLGRTFDFFPPCSWLTSGRSITLACRKGVMETGGIDILEDTMAIDILKSNGRAVGALAVNILTGELMAIKANSVMLATGGYQPFSFKCTVSDTTGDGIAMAYRAGAPIADMEFMLFLPGALLSPQNHRGSIFPYMWFCMTSQMDILNARGTSMREIIPQRIYELSLNSEMGKDIFTYYWGTEVAEGRGTKNGGVYMSLAGIPKDELKKTLAEFNEYMLHWYPEGRYQGDDVSGLIEAAVNGEPWEIGLSDEYSMGGVEIDEKMRTAIPGLYAAGEVTCGLFGANRVNDGLVEMLVQGYRAGLTAAEDSSKCETAAIDGKLFSQRKEHFLHMLENSGGASPNSIIAMIEAAADMGFGPIRSETGLLAAQEELRRIREEELPRMSLSSKTRAYNLEWIQAMQAENLLLCTEAGVAAALMRRESRGTHIRSDFPAVDHDNFLHHIEFRDIDGKMTCTTRPPVVLSVPLPGGRADSIIDYISKMTTRT